MKGCFMICCFFLMACNQNKSVKEPPKSLVQEKINLMDADKAFSNMSEKEGMKAAYLEFADSNVVLLRPNTMPIVGADAIDHLISLDDGGYSLNWEPQQALVSSGADLGFTYGVYGLHLHNEDTSFYGTYVNIWKKQADGKWKLALDSGNEGIELSE